MHTNLVRPAGPREGADHREPFAVPARKTFFHLKLRLGWRAAGGMNHLLEPNCRGLMNALANKRRVDARPLPFRPAPNDGEIFFRDALVLHEQSETPGARGILRDEDQATRLAIEAIDDRDLAAIGDLEREQLFQFAPERSHVSGLGRMHEQERRLVDDDPVGALGDDCKISAPVCAGRLGDG